MRIDAFIWPEERIAHIARHGVTPEEVKQVCFGKSLVQRAKSEGENPVYYVLGQTEAGPTCSASLSDLLTATDTL